MNRLLGIAAVLLALGAACNTQAGTMFTTPVIYVRPSTLDFGAVAANAIATNTFVVENIGSGKLVGKVTVQPPFKVLSGGDYTLRDNEAQIVTLTYTPSGAPSDTQTVRFTGGGGSTVTVIGKLATSPPKKSKRK